MPFSQQTYTGQGIVQPTERSRVGEFLGAGLAGLGAGIGEGIKKFRQDKEEAKELRANLKLFRKTIPEEEREAFDATIEAGSLADLKGLKRGILEMGAFELQELKKQEAEEALATKKFARQKSEQESQFYADYFGMREPQQVRRDFGPDISAAEQRLIEAQQAGFRPEFKFPRDEMREFRPGAFSTQPEPATDTTRPAPLLSMPSVFGGIRPDSQLRSAVSAQGQRIERQAPEQPPRPAGPDLPLEPSPEVQQAERDIQALKVQAAEGDTRPETQREITDRIVKEIPKLIKENPLMAKEAYELLYDQDNKLTFENKLALLKYQDEVKSRFIPGLGTAPSAETAKEMRTLQMADEQIQTGIGRLLEILDTPGKRFDLDLKQESNTIVGLLTGALRVPIVGPGAFSDSEKEMIEKIIQNPTKLFSLDSTTRVALNTLSKRMRADRDAYARSIGLDPYQSGSQSQPSSATSRMSFNPSTKTIQ